jgi:hypothetical protein
LPLLSGQATAQALRLRTLGLSYTSIARVMDTYHGWRMSEAGWRKRCRDAGAVPKHHGIMSPRMRGVAP